MDGTVRPMPGGLQIANRSGRNPAAAAWKLRRGHRVDVVESFPAGSRCWRSRTAVSRSRRKTDIWCKAGSGDPRSGSHRFPGVRSVGRSYAGAQRDARGEGRRNAKDRDGRTGGLRREVPLLHSFSLPSPSVSYLFGIRDSGFGAGSLELRAWDLGFGAWGLVRMDPRVCGDDSRAPLAPAERAYCRSPRSRG